MRNKYMLLTAASILTFSIGTSSFAANNGFSDLDSVDGKTKIESLQKRGFISGISSDKFMPDQSLNAAQGVQMLINSFQLSLAQYQFIKAPEARDSYDHVKDNVWYSDAFIIAAINGLELPRDIQPSASLTREEFTNYVMAAMQKAGNLPLINIKPVEITDENKITPEYQGAIQRSITMNVNELDNKGNFDPKSKITRAEAAVMIYNALDYLQKHPELSGTASQPEANAPSDDALESEN